MDFSFILGLIVLAIFSAFVATWAEKKGHKGIGYFCLSLAFSPIIGLIVVACLKDLTIKECPYCKNKIKKNAVVCSFCGKELVRKKTNQNQDEKEKWISKRIVELVAEGKPAGDAKIQAEAEYSVAQQNKIDEEKKANSIENAEKEIDCLARLSATDTAEKLEIKECGKCGSKNPIGSAFCKDCGAYF